MRYFDEMNILRAFAILAVISIHVSGAFTFMQPGFLAIVYMAIDVFSGFAVPLFLAISGFVLYNKYPEKFDLKKFYGKRLSAVLPPYIIFSTVYLLFDHLRFVDHDLPTILFRYLTGGWNYSYWFIILIIQFYLLYPAILWLFRRCDSRGRSLELLSVAYLAAVLYDAWIVPDVFVLAGTSAPLLGTATKFTGYLFYFIMGIIVRSRYDELLLKQRPDNFLYWLSVPILFGTIMGVIGILHAYFSFPVTRILPVIGNFGEWITAAMFPLYYVVIFVVCLSAALCIVSRKTTAFLVLEKIGHCSFGIYLIHLIFLEQVVRMINRSGFGWDNWLFYPIAFGLTLALSTLSVEIIRRLPGSRYIIGSTGP